MPFFHDRFVVGDKVTWRDDHWARTTDGRQRFGNGPFTITKVIDFSEEDARERGIGHTQWLVLDSVSHALSDEWSGAFFKKVEEKHG